MSESVFRTLQIGLESAWGTSVAATTVFPVDPGSGEFQLNRSIESPEEDYGVIARHQPGRAAVGVRIAEGDLACMARYEDLPRLLQMTISQVASTGGPLYLHTFTADQTSSTVESYTFETADETQDFDVAGVQCTSLTLGFDALQAPGNAPWTVSANLRGIDKAKSTATAALSAPSTLETIEGPWTQIYEGANNTAFGSLSELADHLISYSLTIEDPKPLRIYGATDGDVATGFGRGKRDATFTAQLKISSSATSNLFDIFNVTGGFPTTRRWRIKTNGSNSKYLQIDGQVQFEKVDIVEVRDGERAYEVSGYYVYDSSLSTDLQIVVANGVSGYAAAGS